MGDIREEVELFYLRDYVEEKIETRLIETLSLSDLIFSRNKRVKASFQKQKGFSKFSRIEGLKQVSRNIRVKACFIKQEG